MSKRYLAVGAATVVCLGVAAWAIYNAAFAPIDDPSYFCSGPDPSPMTSIAASTILQDCAAGKTVTLAKGSTVGVDLQGGNGVDTWYQWTDVTVSDGHVLGTVSPPTRVRGIPPQRLDEVAVYRAAQTGQATLTAVEQFCTANGGGGCGRGHLWSVTVRVS
jgi:putative intracellular protease/amidase